MKTGAELKARREELKITQQYLADQIGISRTQLSRIENGKIDARGFVIDRLIGFLGIDTINHIEKESELTINDIKVGDELECIDRDGFINGQSPNVNKEILKHTIIISHFGEYGAYLTVDFWLEEEELKYFRKKPKLQFSDLEVGDKEIASFEELQYVANKALDESIIEKYEVYIGGYGCENIIIHFDGKFTEYNAMASNSAIEFIQSLYTEEFVIETMADELRVKSGAELTLANGINCVYFDDGDRKLRHDGDYYPCNFLILKGATVKQSK